MSMTLLNLSIIIPCYNCEKTLREAVDSCYTQNLSMNEFEIIMVDDGSTDGTYDLMKQLRGEHSNIFLYRHQENKGGGAARNTGITQSKGEIIYCLDSDNFFAPKSVQPMLNFLIEHNLDGVAFYERRFFQGKNSTKFTPNFNKIIKRNIELSNLFDNSGTLTDNFFYTKESYLRTTGYPEHHGFDTQCYEVRFLASGNSLQICPNSVFYHRQGLEETSYFERVHEAGLFSVNYMLIFEDIFYLFTPELQTELVKFPLFAQTKSYAQNIKKLLQNNEHIFIRNYKQYLIPEGGTKWLHDHQVLNEYAILVDAYSDIKYRKYKDAQYKVIHFVESTNINTQYIEFLILRIMNLISGVLYENHMNVTLADLEKMTASKINNKPGPVKKLIMRNQFIHKKLLRIKNKFKKYENT